MTHHPPIALRVVKANKSDWYNINKHFVHLLKDPKVTALSVYGSSTPGSFAIMEHLVDFKLAIDPPPDTAKTLLPGAKAGDPV
ncbi:hypothetical protein MMC29_008097, partial [Sticta canariensis]|nr:hypothetical protein [Sticta canariensis]